MSTKSVIFREGARNKVLNAGADPSVVARSALQNAASIAGLILTTGCVIAKPPKPVLAEAQPEMY